MENVKIKNYNLQHKIFKGVDSIVFTDKTNPQRFYAIKVTHLTPSANHTDDVSFEAKIFKRMETQPGFLKLHDFGKNEHYTYTVTELQGPSLNYLLRLCKGVFSLKTTIMLFDQMVGSTGYKSALHA